MNRKTILRAMLVALPLAAALLYIALNWYRIETETVFVQAGPEARKNPFLAYTRLLERTGAVPRTITGPSQLATLAEGGTLVLGANRLAYMAPSRIRALAAWVERGGTLVVQSEGYAVDDPLLDAFGIERKFADTLKVGTSTRRITPMPGPTQVNIAWPGEEKPLRVIFYGVPPDLRDRLGRVDLIRGSAGGGRSLFLSFGSAKGRVTVVPSLRFLANDSIGKLDHARLGWLIAGADRPGRAVALFTRMETPPFLDWVRTNAWAVAIAAALAVFVWLVRIVPRFGPLAPDAPPVRRSLLEHIVASGRYLWSRREGAYLIEAVRERVWRVAARRGISPPSSPSQRTASVETIARLTTLRPLDVERALFSPAAVARDFTEDAARLQDIESALALRARRTPRKVRP